MKAISLTVFFFLALAFGTSYTKTPESEVLFDATRLPHVCVKASCIASYSARIGNTGKKSASNIFALIVKGRATRFALPPKLTSEGKIPKDMRIAETDEGAHVALGDLEPAEWMDLRFSLEFAAENEILSPQEAISKVGFDQGIAKAGSPTATRFTRALTSMLDLLL